MFAGQESVRIRTEKSRDEIEELLAESLGDVGKVKFGKRDGFRLVGQKFKDTFAETEVDGTLEEGRKENEWIVRIDLKITPTPLCWIIAIAGFFVVLVAPLIFLIPYMAKGELEKKIRSGLDDAKEAAEGKKKKRRRDEDDEDEEED
jgi:hypothetical protein